MKASDDFLPRYRPERPAGRAAILKAGCAATRPPIATQWLPPFAGFFFALFSFFGGEPSLAADKSGVSPNAISLPKGPGSIEGLGESFQASLNTGTAKYGLSIQVPPGTSGHTPGLRLGYDGGGGNGPLGIGWSMGISAVQRRTDRGIPTYGEPVGFIREDVFLDSGKEELVLQADAYWFCKNEGAFLRYRQVSNHWEASSPGGARLAFGVSAEARIQDGTTGHVFSWLLQRDTDIHGNCVLFSYKVFSGLQNTNQKYLETITYGPGAPPWENFHFIRLEYEDRPDWFEDCRAGFVVRTGKRLKRIIVGTEGPTLAGHQQGDFNGDGITDNLNRIYELEYVHYAGTNSHWSLLGSVRLIGADGVSTLPPAAYGYVISNPPDELSAAGREMEGVNEPTLVMDNERVDLLDVNADGLPDVLRTGGPTHLAWLNRGETNEAGVRKLRWEGPVEIESVTGDAWQFELSSTSTHLADMDGDGLADLVHKAADGSVFYFGNRGQQTWGERQPMSAEVFAPPAPFGTPDVRTADVDFDKRMDLIRGDGLEYQVWFNFGQNQYSERITVPAEAGFDFSLPGVQMADMNGDRVPDVARVRPMTVEVTAGLGYGRFASLIAVPIPDGPLDGTQMAKAKLTDINGDGLADLVLERAEPGTVWYWLNLGNYTLSGRKIIRGMPTTMGQNAVIRWADLNGNGTTDLVYADSSASTRLRVVDLGELLNGGGAPNCLVAISNGIGGVTLIGYQSSTKFALADAAVGRPWPEAMPMPVTVVAAITNGDSLGHWYVTLCRYHDGYYDGAEKQFRGFAQAEQAELGDDTAPTLVTRSDFDVGRAFEAMKGKLLRLTAEQEDGRVFWEETTTWASPPRVLMTGTNGTNVVFAHPVTKAKVVKELGQGTERRLESGMAFDDFGNQTTNANYGIVENGDLSAFDDERITTAEFAINTNAWLLRTPKRTETQDAQGHVLSRAEFYYDDETFSGGNLGQVTRGNLTLKREWIDPANPGAYVASVRTRYDTFGNAVQTLDPLAAVSGGSVDQSRGHVREIEYDSLFHTYVVREIIRLEENKTPLSLRVEMDYGLAAITASLDYNTNRTVYGLDAFGRLVAVVAPGDSLTYPSTEYEYIVGVPVREGAWINFIEVRQLDREPGTAGAKRDHYYISRRFTDGLGREWMSKSEAEPAPGTTSPRVIIRGAALFHARKGSWKTLSPCFSSRNGASLEELLDFEETEAPGWQGLFDQEGVLAPRPLAGAPATSTAYDATLRVRKITHADGSFRLTAYEPLVTMSYDENDVDPGSPHHDTPMVLAHDGQGRLVRVDELAALNDDGTRAGERRTWSTHYAYDANGQLVRITDSQNNTRTFTFDGLNRMTSSSDPNRGLTRWLYDEASNLIESSDAKGQRVTCTYDGVNRILTKDFHDEGGEGFSYGRSPDVLFHYDSPYLDLPQGDASVATANNLAGALAWVEDHAGDEHSSFDARGRTEWTVRRIDNSMVTGDPGTSAGLTPYRTAFAYDVAGRIVRMTYPDFDEVTFEYNERGLLRRIPGGPTGEIVSNIDYLPSGEKSGERFGNGVLSTYLHDVRHRLKSIQTFSSNPVPDTELIHFQYLLDPATTLRGIQDLRPAEAIPEGDAHRNSQLLEYDDLYRLTGVQYSFNLPSQPTRNDGEIHYRYDRLGNMLAQTSTLAPGAGTPLPGQGEMECGGVGGTWNRSGRAAGDPPGPHALTVVRKSEQETQSILYDANGNMTGLGALTCTYDFADHLVLAENAEMQAQYVYNHTGRRMAKRVRHRAATNVVGFDPPSSSVLYINQFFEVREREAPVKYVWSGAARVARVTGSISAKPRLQRIRLFRGWNLCSLAVTASNALQQVQAARPGLFPSAFRWNPETRDWVPLSPDETLPAGAVLWIQAVSNAVLGVSGSYSVPAAQTVETGGHFVPAAGLEVWDFLSGSNASPATAFWRFDASAQRWRISLPQALPGFADLPAGVAPGEALFVHVDASAELPMPDPALRFCYYHPDHLGSAVCITDSQGRPVETANFYPFGAPRTQDRSYSRTESYQFTQKERDQETGLHYFESRFLDSTLGRFTQCDPIATAEGGGRLASPQRLHTYAYAGNSPLVRTDPLGQDYKENFWKGVEVQKDFFKGMARSAAGMVEDAGEAVAEQLSSPEGVVEAVTAIATAPITGGFQLVGGVGALSYSATQDAISAATGEDAVTLARLSDRERAERAGGGTLKAAMVVGTIAAFRTPSAPSGPRSFRSGGVDPFAKTQVDAFTKTQVDAFAKTQVDAFAKTQVDAMAKTQVDAMAKTQVDAFGKTHVEDFALRSTVRAQEATPAAGGVDRKQMAGQFRRMMLDQTSDYRDQVMLEQGSHAAAKLYQHINEMTVSIFGMW
jgi:RHS repeat-associated protein